MTVPTPAFVTLTGCDRSDVIGDLQTLAAKYSGKVEFGILIDPKKFGTARFPSQSTITDLRHSGLRLSAHLCGDIADAIFAGRDVDIDLAGFSRAQINLLGRHARTAEIENAIGFGLAHDFRIILQCTARYPTDTRCDWLLDASFGTGRRVVHVPDMTKTSAFCGISGGLSSTSVKDTLAALPDMTPKFWVDAETSLFENGAFSASTCTAFLRSVYG